MVMWSIPSLNCSELFCSKYCKYDAKLIFIPDDMEIAPDFFDYFEAAATLMEKDKFVFLTKTPKSCTQRIILFTTFHSNYCRSIMAVSSWNDNGQEQFVHDPCK